MTVTVKTTASTEWIVTGFGVVKVIRQVWSVQQVESVQGTEVTMTVGYCWSQKGMTSGGYTPSSFVCKAGIVLPQL